MPRIAASFKSDLEAAKKVRVPWWVLLPTIIVSAFAAGLLDHFGRLYLALPILNTIGMITFVIAVKWKLNRSPWFWITMTLVATLHVPLILLIPWTTKWVPALAIAAIDSADVCLILATLSVVETFLERPRPADNE